MLSIGAVARQTGIGASTLRKWELRYGFPVPLRSESGRRMFQQSDVAKIQLIARALAQGLRVSKAIESVLKVSVQPDIGSIRKSKLGGVVAHAIALIQSNNTVLFEEYAEAALSRMGMVSFVEDFALPLIKEVGAQWQAGSLPIYREHVFSSQLSNLVARYTKAPNADQTRPRHVKATAPILLALPAGEHHALALTLLNALMREGGLPTILMQSGLPASEIANAAISYRAGIVALSCSEASPKKLLLNELKELRRVLPATVEMWVGGSGALKLPGGIEGVVFNNSMNQAVNRALDKCQDDSLPQDRIV